MDESRKHSQHVILEIGSLKEILAIYCTFKRTIRVFIYGFFNYSVTAESDYDHQLHRIPLLC